MLSAIKWDRQYHAMLATPLRVRDVMLGHQAFFAFRLLLTATVYFVVITAFGAVDSPLGVLAIPVTVLVGLSFTTPLAAWAARTENEVSFVAIFRFVILPMFLFSGTFFPISTPAGPARGHRLVHAALARRDALSGSDARRRVAGRSPARRVPARVRDGRPRSLARITYRRRLVV